MVSGVVNYNSDVMLLFIFPHGVVLNTEAHIKCLEKVVLTWIERVAAERPYICHTSRTQSWQLDNFCDHTTPNIWPSNSQDYYPLNYHVWSRVKRENYKISCNTKDNLKSRITVAFTNLNTEIIEKVCRRF